MILVLNCHLTTMSTILLFVHRTSAILHLRHPFLSQKGSLFWKANLEVIQSRNSSVIWKCFRREKD